MKKKDDEIKVVKDGKGGAYITISLPDGRVTQVHANVYQNMDENPSIEGFFKRLTNVFKEERLEKMN